MARLSILLCVALLLITVASARELRGYKSGGKSQGGKSSQKGKGGSSEEVDPKPIDKAEFKTELQTFAKIFTDASEGLGEVENLTRTAHASGAPEDWYAVYLKFLTVGHEDLSKLEPAIDGMGHVIERIAESPDEFPPLPYCDSSLKLANGDTPITTSFSATRELALIEDLGCFKDKLLKVTELDIEAMSKPEYTELEAIQAYMNIIEEAIQLGMAFERFGDAQERLSDQQSSGGASKRSEDGTEADLKKLVRLLKELKLDRKR